MGANWVPKKLEVDVPAPLTLSLERFRSSGPSPGEARSRRVESGLGPSESLAPVALERGRPRRIRAENTPWTQVLQPEPAPAAVAAAEAAPGRLGGAAGGGGGRGVEPDGSIVAQAR